MLIDVTNKHTAFPSSFPALASCHGLCRRMQALCAIVAVFGAATQETLLSFCVCVPFGGLFWSVRQLGVIRCALVHTCEFLQQAGICVCVCVGHAVVLYKLPNSHILPSEQLILLLHCVDVRLHVSTFTCSSSGCQNT
jgi:hypothetical protein